MAHPARTALVLQGGGALGAYELGAARALYEQDGFSPDVVAGVSIGAITAALLVRPAPGLTPLQALEAFWRKVTVAAPLLPPFLKPYASVFGNRNFFVPRLDILNWWSWTSFYDTSPLRHTLSELLDLKALADPGAEPRLFVTATDLEKGELTYFDSRDGLALDHIIASGSLPPSFPMTTIGKTPYWDGGLFDNTPLGAVLDRLDQEPDAQRTVYVVNLFPNRAPIPTNLSEVTARMTGLQFANKTAGDVKLLERFNQVALLVKALDEHPGGNPLADDPAYLAVKRQAYVHVPDIVSITLPDTVGGFEGSDFSPDAITARAAEGYAQTKAALVRRRGG
jgi:predicted acylesterase/phospholipase RssA